ncbi:hypothetical protein IFR05_011323 [Cadophora sp. M221]|nr:hypothetical protein IFR05_011323 [Cadophora sp. M221]
MEDNSKSQNVVACNTCYDLRRGYTSDHDRGYPEVTVPLSQLVRSCQSGCLTCGVLVEIVVRCVPRATKESDGSVSWWRIWGSIDLCWIPANKSQDRIWLDVFQAPGQRIQFDNVRIGKCPSGYTGSTLALNLAMEWITECISNHKLCGGGSPKPLPTRILDLGIGDQCLEANIIIGEDAIEVAKRLGLRYLWIDSVCIIQDDEEDWERESSKMADVYQNSYITIAATCAADSSVGMFSIARAIHHPRLINYSQHGIESQLHASACLLITPVIPSTSLTTHFTTGPYTIHWIFLYLVVPGSTRKDSCRPESYTS